MARNFYSSAYRGGVPFRTIADQPVEITATVEIPASYVLQTADKIYLFKLGANHSIEEMTIRTSALDNAQTATLTLDLGYEAAVATDDPNAYIAASTVPRAGGQVRVENGGDDPFAVGAMALIAETIDVYASAAASAAAAAGSGSLGVGTGGGFVTVTAKISRRTGTLDPDQPGYAYADRYSTSGVSST